MHQRKMCLILRLIRFICNLDTREQRCIWTTVAEASYLVQWLRYLYIMVYLSLCVLYDIGRPAASRLLNPIHLPDLANALSVLVLLGLAPGEQVGEEAGEKETKDWLSRQPTPIMRWVTNECFAATTRSSLCVSPGPLSHLPLLCC